MITITDSAALRIKFLAKQEDSSDSLRLRLTVLGGGCSGFQYSFTLDDAQQEGDLVIAHQGAEMIFDEVSLQFIKDAQIDFEETLMGATFVIKNPNATSSCGCGSSFSVTP